MKLFEPLEELRERFLQGWIDFEKNGKAYAIRYVDGEDDVDLPVGELSETAYGRFFKADFGLEMPVDRAVEMLPTLRSDPKHEAIANLLLQAAITFALRHLPKLNISRKRAEFYVHYARLMRPDSHGPTVELAFALYVLDRVE